MEMVRIENNSHMIEITCYVGAFMVFKTFFCIFSHKVVKIWFVLLETWHTTLFGIYYCVDMIKIENNAHIPKIMCKVIFYRFLSVFGIFSHKVV